MKKLKYILIGFILGGLFFTGVSSAETTFKTIKAAFPSLNFIINGQVIEKSNKPSSFIVNGTTYVPLRFIADSLGQSITWDGDSQTIYMGNGQNAKMVNMVDMKPKSNNDALVETIPTLQLNDGSKFGRGFKIKEILDPINNELKDGTLDRYYQLNGRFNHFDVYLSPDNSWNGGFADSNIGELNIYADDKLIYRSGPVNSQTKPIRVSIPLTGVKDFDVQIKNGANICLVDGIFSLK